MAKIGLLICALTICQGYANPGDDLFDGVSNNDTSWQDFWEYNEVDSDRDMTEDLDDLFPNQNSTFLAPNEESKAVTQFSVAFPIRL